MEILPPPDPRDDPLFAVRVAVGVMLSFLLIEPLAVPIPALMPALTLGLLAGQRGAFNAKKAFGGAIMIPLIAWIMAGLASLTRGDPAVFIVIFGLVAFAGFYLLIVLASPLGILLLIFPALLSAMALLADAALVAMRDSMIISGLAAGVLVPLLYVVFPPRTRVVYEHPTERPHLERPLTEVMIRMAVFVPALLPFYFGVETSSIIYPIIIVFVLAHPEHVLRRREAIERVVSTCMGGGIALVVLGLLTVQPHLPVLLLLVLIAGLWFGHRMTTGPFTPMTYQFGFSVMIVVVASGLTGRDPWEVAVQRTVLTLAGAMAALLLLAFLEEIFIVRPAQAALR
jgi:hypothetical protein